jgi:glucose/mannose transport system substrate-binding protein
MKKGLEILAAGNTIISGDEAMARDTVVQIEELMAEFWSGTEMTAADAQARYVDIIGAAE